MYDHDHRPQANWTPNSAKQPSSGSDEDEHDRQADIGGQSRSGQPGQGGSDCAGSQPGEPETPVGRDPRHDLSNLLR